MGKRTSSILIIILNILTLLATLVIGYFFIVLFSVAHIDLFMPIFLAMIVFVGGIETLKWVAYYKVFKRHQSNWMIIYWGFTFLYVLLSTVMATVGFLFILLPIGYGFALFAYYNEEKHMKRESEEESQVYAGHLKDDVMGPEMKQEHESEEPESEPDSKSSQQQEQPEPPKRQQKEEKLESKPKNKHPLTYKLAIGAFLITVLLLTYRLLSSLVFIIQVVIPYFNVLSGMIIFETIVFALFAGLGWYALYKMNKNRNSHWKHYFIIPFLYQLYHLIRHIVSLNQYDTADYSDLLSYPSTYINAIAFLAYIIGFFLLSFSSKGTQEEGK